MTKKEIIKAGVKMIVTFGVGTIVTNAVAFTTPTMTMSVLKRVAVGIGSIVLSAYVSEKVSNYIFEEVDELLNYKEEVTN